jgi:hypothetical protein
MIWKKIPWLPDRFEVSDEGQVRTLPYTTPHRRAGGVKVAAAAQLLQAELGGGAVISKAALEARAEAVGIRPRTLETAARRVGVTYHRRSGQPSLWAIPFEHIANPLPTTIDTTRHLKGRVLKRVAGRVDGSAALRARPHVSIFIGRGRAKNVSRLWAVNKLVLAAFEGMPYDRDDETSRVLWKIEHLDGDEQNCRLDNLRWRRRYATKPAGPTFGSDDHLSKLRRMYEE